jgi:hypothetical protein
MFKKQSNENIKNECAVAKKKRLAQIYNKILFKKNVLASGFDEISDFF